MPIDIESLLQPITPVDNCGEDLLLSSRFDAIQQARQHDDPNLDQGDWVIDRREADWPFVVQECSALLRDQTKDLRLAAWLTEAAGRLWGLAGIADGYGLLVGLCERYWDEVHPRAEDGDMDMRIGNVTWLLGRTADLLRGSPLVSSPRGTVTLLAWQTAVALDQAIKRNPSDTEDLQRGKVTVDMLDQIRQSAPGAQLRDLQVHFQACKSQILRLESIFDQHLPDDGPSFGALKDVVADLEHLLRRFAADAGVPYASAAAAPMTQSATLHAVPNAPSPSAPVQPVESSTIVHTIETREQAIAQLRLVAQFFERTEPSSPAAYMARKAAKWGELSLHDWLRHVVKNDDELGQLEEMLGVVENARTQRDGG